jgi:ectoine hydroxylase-related dioxygenase (phytanoyl-CoA dioxygenase family)
MNWRRAIEEDGFAILPGIFPQQEADCLLEQIAALAPNHSRAGVRNAMALPPASALARRADMMELARGVLGSQAFPFRATIFNKSPTANWLVVWHQDTALPLQTRVDVQGWGPWSVKEGISYAHAPATALAQVVALRVSLDDSTLDNGPLRVLPKTHTFGALTDDNIHDLALRIPPVSCIVPKGGILAMKPLIVHASSKSQTKFPRRVLHIEYAASETIAKPLQIAVA